jgi:hypothetical protein
MDMDFRVDPRLGAGEMMAWRHEQSDVSGAVHNVRRGGTQL